MEYGFIHCVTNTNMVRVPVSKIPESVAVYVSGIYDISNYEPCFSEVPFSIEVDGEAKELVISRPPGPFMWAVVNPNEEGIGHTEMPKKFFFIFDKRTGLIHNINSTTGEPKFWGYQDVFSFVESDKYVNPLVKAIDKDGNFAPIGATIMSTWYRKQDYPSKLGIITSWNIPCGIAEYSRQILEQCDFDYAILSPYAKDGTLEPDGDNVYRCFERFSIQQLKETIKRLEIDNLWVHYSYTWFDDDSWTEFLTWCKTNNIRYAVFAHSQIKPQHEHLVGDYVTGNPNHSNCVPIAPPEYRSTVRPQKFTVGTFGFAHAHKCFENVYPFIMDHNKFHYHIWTSTGQGPDAKLASDQYIRYLQASAVQLGIADRVHIHVGFLSEQQLIDNLSSCSILVLPYKDIPNENQSAAIALMRATGRPIATSSSPKVRDYGDIWNHAGICAALEALMADIGEYERMALRKRVIYTKKDEAISHLKYIKPYGDLKLLWRGDLVGVKSFTIVNQKYIQILQDWGAEIALCPDNHDFKMDEEPLFIQNACRVEPTNDMISTGIHFPPLFSYCTAPMGAWETSRCPLNWVDAIGTQFKKSIVISNFVKDSFIYGGFSEDQLAVVPLGVDCYDYTTEKDNIYNVSSKEKVNTNRPFTFLSVSWAEPRKGTDLLIDAYTRTFKAKDDVLLVLKTTLKNQWLEDIIAMFKKKRPHSAPIVIVEGVQDDISSVYRCADVFVHPLRGEGFGLPVLEAAAHGVPSIVTKWAGPLDFTNQHTGWYIDFKLVEAEYHHFVEGAKWAQPNVHHLSHLMKHAYRNPNEVAQKGFNAFVNSLQFSWERSADSLVKVFQEL